MFDIKFKICDLILKNFCKVKCSKIGYSEYVYKELIFLAKCFLFFMVLLYVVNLMNVMNYVYNEVNSFIFGILL